MTELRWENDPLGIVNHVSDFDHVQVIDFTDSTLRQDLRYMDPGTPDHEPRATNEA